MHDRSHQTWGGLYPCHMGQSTVMVFSPTRKGGGRGGSFLLLYFTSIYGGTGFRFVFQPTRPKGVKIDPHTCALLRARAGTKTGPGARAPYLIYGLRRNSTA